MNQLCNTGQIIAVYFLRVVNQLKHKLKLVTAFLKIENVFKEQS